MFLILELTGIPLDGIDWGGVFEFVAPTIPFFVFWGIVLVAIFFARIFLEKLLSKLTAKKRLKRDIEEAKYRRMIEELAQEELYGAKNPTRYSNSQSAKIDRNKFNRK